MIDGLIVIYMLSTTIHHCIGLSQVHSGDNPPSSEGATLGLDYVISCTITVTLHGPSLGKIDPSLHYLPGLEMRYRDYVMDKHGRI